MKKGLLIGVLLLMNGFCWSQTGSVPTEFPSKIIWDGHTFILFTEAQLEKIVDFRIDYKEKVATLNQYENRLESSNLLIREGKREIHSLRTEADKLRSIVELDSKLVQLKDDQIKLLDKKVRKLKFKNKLIIGGSGLAVIGILLLSITK